MRSELFDMLIAGPSHADAEAQVAAEATANSLIEDLEQALESGNRQSVYVALGGLLDALGNHGRIADILVNQRSRVRELLNVHLGNGELSEDEYLEILPLGITDDSDVTISNLDQQETETFTGEESGAYSDVEHQLENAEWYHDIAGTTSEIESGPSDVAAGVPLRARDMLPISDIGDGDENDLYIPGTPELSDEEDALAGYPEPGLVGESPCLSPGACRSSYENGGIGTKDDILDNGYDGDVESEYEEGGQWGPEQRKQSGARDTSERNTTSGSEQDPLRVTEESPETSVEVHPKQSPMDAPDSVPPRDNRPVQPSPEEVEVPNRPNQWPGDNVDRISVLSESSNNGPDLGHDGPQAGDLSQWDALGTSLGSLEAGSTASNSVGLAVASATTLVGLTGLAVAGAMGSLSDNAQEPSTSIDESALERHPSPENPLEEGQVSKDSEDRIGTDVTAEARVDNREETSAGSVSHGLPKGKRFSMRLTVRVNNGKKVPVDSICRNCG